MTRREPMDLSLNSQRNIRDGITQDLVMEESRQQVQYRSEPQYDLMISAFNILKRGAYAESFRSVQQVFRETNQNIGYDKQIRGLLEAQDFDDIKEHEKIITGYAMRTGYSTGGNEIPMSELLDSSAVKQMKAIMGPDTKPEDIIDHIRELEQETIESDEKTTEQRLDSLSDQQAKKNSSTGDSEMTKISRKSRTNRNESTQPAQMTNTPIRGQRQQTGRKPQERNGTSKEAMRQARADKFENIFNDVRNEMANIGDMVMNVSNLGTEMTITSFDHETATVAQIVTTALSNLMEEVEDAIASLSLGEDDMDEDDFEAAMYDEGDDEDDEMDVDPDGALTRK